MSTRTGIEWTDTHWRPIRDGRLDEKHLFDPLKWGPVKWYDPDDGELMEVTPRRVFVNSMSDLFHEAVPDEWIDRIFAVMALCPQHTFQVLTKRPERMREYIIDTALRGMGLGQDVVTRIADRCDIAPVELRRRWPLPNVWLGVSVEDQPTADKRIPLLLQTPAAVRFVSAEPLQNDVDIRRWLGGVDIVREHGGHGKVIGRKRDGLDWVICGGESGPGARPMHPDWVRSLRDQCQAAAVPFFMKQMGSVFGPKKGHDIPDDLDIKEFPNA